VHTTHYLTGRDDLLQKVTILEEEKGRDVVVLEIWDYLSSYSLDKLVCGVLLCKYIPALY